MDSLPNTCLIKVNVEAEATIRNAIEYVKNQQKSVLDALEKSEKQVQIVTPAFQWAQSLDNVFINIKYAQRFDTPGCLETYDENITIEEKKLTINIFCKHVCFDKSLMKF